MDTLWESGPLSREMNGPPPHKQTITCSSATGGKLWAWKVEPTQNCRSVFIDYNFKMLNFRAEKHFYRMNLNINLVFMKKVQVQEGQGSVFLTDISDVQRRNTEPQVSWPLEPLEQSPAPSLIPPRFWRLTWSNWWIINKSVLRNLFISKSNLDPCH